MIPYRQLLSVPVLVVGLHACGGSSDDRDAAVEEGVRSEAVAGPSSDPIGESAAAGSDRSGDPVESESRPLEPEPPVDVPADWTLLRLPTGFELHHPADWQVTETVGGLLFVPPGADPLRESIQGTAADAGGLRDPMSRSAGRSMDAEVARAMPFLERSEEPRALAVGELEGAVYDYRGRPPGGPWVRGRAWVLIHDGGIGGLSLVAEEDRFDRWVDVVERMFTSLRESPDEPSGSKAGSSASGDLDPNLVGRYQGESIASGQGVYVNTQLIWDFRGDGTVTYGVQSAWSASDRDHAGDLEWTAGGETGDSTSRGRWTTRNGILEIRWDDGSKGTYAYSFEPDGSLVARHPLTRELINFYPPIR